VLLEGSDDDILNVSCRNTGHRSDLGRLRLAMQTWNRDVIAIADAGLGRVCRHHAVTGIIEQQSGQEVVACAAQTGCGPAKADRSMDRQAAFMRFDRD
jgi:hypothetical protein